MADKDNAIDQQKPSEGQSEEPTAADVAEVEAIVSKHPQLVMELMRQELSFETGPSLPLAKHVTPAHITQVLTYGNDRDERQFKFHSKRDERENGRFWLLVIASLVALCVVLAVVCFIVATFSDKPETVMPLITGLGGGLGGLMAGGGVGYSVGNRSRRKAGP